MEEAINKRYTQLAESSCCLSCGGALDKSGITEGEVCIDLGSGRGNDVVRMAEIVGPNGFVYGIDSTPGMISKGRKTAEKLGVENVEFILSGLEEIPLESSIADLIISNCVLNHVSNKDLVWQEINRLLKPGGRFTISDIYALEPVPSEYSSDPEAVAECWAGSVTWDEYMDNIARAGFRSIDVIEKSQPYEKGKIKVCSFTVSGIKTGKKT
jgi:arsenite methyltransferase